MTAEQSAAFVNAKAALLYTEVVGMQAANQQQLNAGNPPVYEQGDFCATMNRYEGDLGHNALITLFRDSMP